MLSSTTRRLLPLMRASTCLRTASVLQTQSVRFVNLPTGELYDRTPSTDKDRWVNPKKYQNPYDVPLTEQAKEVASDAKEKLSELAEKAKRGAKRTARSVSNAASAAASAISPDISRAGDRRSRLHTSAFPAAIEDRDSSIDQLQDDARRMKNKAGNNLEKAKLATQSAAIDIKEGAQAVGHKIKSAARKAKDVIVDAATTPVPPSASADRFDPADAYSESEPVRQASMSEELSTSAGRDRSWTVGDRDHAIASNNEASSIEADQSALKSSFMDGPQEMPQGVGKRARDADGKPMETGADRT